MVSNSGGAVPCTGTVLDEAGGFLIEGSGLGVCVGVGSCEGEDPVLTSVASPLLIRLKKLTKEANLCLSAVGGACPAGRVWLRFCPWLGVGLLPNISS